MEALEIQHYWSIGIQFIFDVSFNFLFGKKTKYKI